MSVSLPRTSNVSTVSSSPENASASATGASFTGVTSMVMVPTSDVSGPSGVRPEPVMSQPQPLRMRLYGSPVSVTVNVKVTGPVKFALGV